MSEKKSKTKKSSLSDTFFKRASKLAGVTASIAAKEVSIFLKNNRSKSELAALLDDRMDQAQELVKALSELKGAAMKAGQWLSIEFGDLLPPEITAILRQLHDQSIPMENLQVQQILRREWGEEKFAQVTQLSHDAIASASIGQVHSAQLKAEKIAIKVQFPNVSKSIGSDLFMLKKICQTYLLVSGKEIPIDEIFEELKDVLSREVDYKTEAKFLDLYRQGLSSDHRFVVPRVFPEFSTQSVLCLTFEEGITIDQWLKSKRTQEETQWVGRAFIELVIKEFFELGLVQSDPNYGNFLIRPKLQQIVLLDLGASRIYDARTTRKVLKIIRIAEKKDPLELLAAAYQEKLLDPRESEEIKNLLVELLNTIVSIFDPSSQPFHFADPVFIATLREQSLAFARKAQYTAPAKDLLLLNRKLGGIFHLLKDADCSLDLYQIWSSVQARIDRTV